MNTQFRSRISEIIDYSSLLNYGLCCKGITAVGFTGEFNFTSCYATGGIFTPYSGNIITNTGGILITDRCSRAQNCGSSSSSTSSSSSSTSSSSSSTSSSSSSTSSSSSSTSSSSSSTSSSSTSSSSSSSICPCSACIQEESPFAIVCNICVGGTCPPGTVLSVGPPAVPCDYPTHGFC